MRNSFVRDINLPKTQSFFLFGARGTGKSTLLKERFDAKTTHWIDLLDTATEERLSKSPSMLRAEILSLPDSKRDCVIDEIQKIPRLLDEVHHLIENDKSKLRFILTGSSARKLKAGGANLLAGRAVIRALFTLNPIELGQCFDLDKFLKYGGLPQIWNLIDEEEMQDYLRAYCTNYLKQEVWVEQLVRSLEPFRRFLEVAAQCSGKILNFRNIARDTGADAKTIPNWFSILEDTLVGFYLDSYDTSLRKQVRKAAKFYLFDTGVTRALAGMLRQNLLPGTSYYGDIFEQFIVSQVYFYNETHRLDFKLSYLKTKAGVEVDLVIQRPGKPLLFVEIKSREQVDERDVRHLRSLSESQIDAEFLLVSKDVVPKMYGLCRCVHYLEFLQSIRAQ